MPVSPMIEITYCRLCGWGLRAGPAAGDGCDAAGQMIPFAQSRVERLATGDPVILRWPASFGRLLDHEEPQGEHA